VQGAKTAGPATKAAPPRERRFTTVDRDAEREQEARSERWMLALQLVGLTAALVALGFVGWRLTRPASADALYAAIAGEVESDEGELSAVDDEVAEFLERFADDERAAQVRLWADELELEQLERRLRAQARFTGGEAAHPAAQIYAEAVSLEQTDAARAIEMLESLLALYRPSGATADVDEDARPYVVLAQRQAQRLRETLARHAAERLPALEERFAAARALEESAPTRAAKMYRAIDDLYGDEPWAAGVVEQARGRLKALGGK
jgi:hypothetical protein